MHLIKQNNHFISFNKDQAEKVLEKLKDKTIAILDFESFQLDSQNKRKYNLDINSIPFCFAVGIVKYNEKNNSFHLEKEYDYNFWKVESFKDLLKKLKTTSLKLNQICEENKVDLFAFIGAENELKCFDFFNGLLKTKAMSTIFQKSKLIKSRYYDLYKYFNDKKYFNVLQNNFKISSFFEINERKDPIKSRQIGIAAGKHFNAMIRGENSVSGNRLITKIKEHNIIDIYKGYIMVNYLNDLVNIDKSKIINLKNLNNEDCKLKFSII